MPSRTDRLLKLLQLLRTSRHPKSARLLAQELCISVRSVYRDIDTLRHQGAVIDGEAGVGFVLQQDCNLPPLMFSENELEALMLGMRWAAAHADGKMAEAARSVSPAILTYLAELFPEKRLIPAVGTPERGQYYRWLWFGTQLEYAILDRWQQVPQSEDRRRAIGYGDFDTALHTLQTLLADGREYAVGQHFSALDIYLTALLAWGTFRAQVLPNVEPFASYMQRHLQRPAAQVLKK